MKAKAPVLPDELYSVDQFLAVAEELHQYGRGLSASSAKPKPSELSALAESMLATLPAARRVDAAVVEQLRQALEALAGNAPGITLTLAATAPAALRVELVSWLRKNIHPNVLVNFHVNPDIAGGMIIQSPNHIFDCSFRSGLLGKADNFTKVLERV